MQGEDYIVLSAESEGDEDQSERTEEGLVAQEMSEQSRLRHPPSGAFFPRGGGDGTVCMGPTPFLTASSIQFSVPFAPTYDVGTRFSVGVPPSVVSPGTAAWCQSLMRPPIPPNFYGAQDGPAFTPQFGGRTRPQPVPLKPVMPTSQLSTMSIEEIVEDEPDESAVSNPRMEAGGSPLGEKATEKVGTQTRAQTKRQKMGDESTPVKEKPQFSGVTDKQPPIPTTVVSSPITVTYSASRVGASSETTPSTSAEPPWQSEADRLLSQIAFEKRYDSEGEVDYPHLTRELGERLDRAAELIEALVKQKRKLNDKNGDLNLRLKLMEQEMSDTAITHDLLLQDMERLQTQDAVTQARCEHLQLELNKAEKSHQVIEEMRKNQDEQYSALYDQYQTSNQETQKFIGDVTRLEREKAQITTERNECRKIAQEIVVQDAKKDAEMKLMKERLAVYCAQAVEPQFQFDSARPPVNSKIVRMIYKTMDKRAGSVTPPRVPVTAQWVPNASAPSFTMPSPSVPPVVPVTSAHTPSTQASTQQATDATPPPQQPPAPAPQPVGISAGNAPKLPKPKTFSVTRAGNCYTEFKKWAAEVRSYLVLTKVDPDLWTECIVYYLEGFARERMWKELQYWKNTYERPMSYDEFCAFMTDKVIPPRNPALASAELERMQYRQGSETLAAFKDRILDNLQVQKDDSPLGDSDYETAKVIFLNKLPDSYRIFIYRQKWVMESPTIDNYQKAAEMFEVSNDLGSKEYRDRSGNWPSFRTRNRAGFSSGNRSNYFRSQSRSRNWNGGRNKTTYNRTNGRNEPFSANPLVNEDRSPAFSAQANRSDSRSPTPSASGGAPPPSGIQCYTCRRWGHMSKDCPNRGRTSSPSPGPGTKRTSGSPGRRTRINTVQAEVVPKKDWTLDPREILESTGTDSEDYVRVTNSEPTRAVPSFCRANLVYTNDFELQPYGSEAVLSGVLDGIEDLVEDKSTSVLVAASTPGVAMPSGSPVMVAPTKEQPVDVAIMVEGLSVAVKLDSGAAATIIPQWCFKQLRDAKGEEFIKSRSCPSNLHLYTYTGAKIVSNIELLLEFDTGFSRMFIPCAVDTEDELETSHWKAILLGQNGMLALGYSIYDPSGKKISPDPATEVKYSAIREVWQWHFEDLTKPVSEYPEIEINASGIYVDILVRHNKIEELLRQECKRRIDFLKDPKIGITHAEYQMWLAKLYKTRDPDMFMQLFWQRAKEEQERTGELCVLVVRPSDTPVQQPRRGMVTPTQLYKLFPNSDYSIDDKRSDGKESQPQGSEGNSEKTAAGKAEEAKPSEAAKYAVLSKEGHITVSTSSKQDQMAITVAQYFKEQERKRQRQKDWDDRRREYEEAKKTKAKFKIPKPKLRWSEEVEIIEEDGQVYKEPLINDGKFLAVHLAEEAFLPGNEHPDSVTQGHRRKFIVLQARDFINCPNLHGHSFRFKPVPSLAEAGFHLADALVIPDQLGHFSVECYNDHSEDRKLKIQKAGQLYRVEPTTVTEAARGLTGELLETCKDKLIEDEVLPDLIHLDRVYSPSKRSTEERQAELAKKLNIDEETLSPEQVEKVRNLLLEKVDAFSAFPDEIGRTTLAEHDIVLNDPDQRPIVQKCRRLPLALRDEVENHLKELLELGLIRPSDSDWSHPIVPVRKRNGRIRVCVDYRILNSSTRKDSSPLPNINELIDEAGINGATRFSSMDLMMGFHQVGLTPRAQRYAAFTCHLGQFTYTCMPFGLCNAPATFANAMRKLQATLDRNKMLVYLDDILIATRTVEEHLDNLREVLDKFIEHGLTAKPEKSFFLKTELLYLGFIISADGVKADPQKLKAIREYPKPQTPKKMRGFYGLCSYYRRFIKDFSKLAKPLTNALKGKPKSITWTFEMDEAFDRLKEIMMTPPVLAYPQVNQPYFIYCDGSLEGLGCVLEQLDSQGKSHPIAYGSRTLSPQEQNYSATELEAAAVIYALDHFDVYIRNQECTVVSDHSALSSILTSKINLTNNRQIRWRNRFMGSGVKVKYRPGSHQKVPDGLSRAPLTDSQLSDPLPTEIDPYDELIAFTEAELCTLAEDDIGLKKILRAETAQNSVVNDKEFLEWVRAEQLKDSQLRSIMDYLERKQTRALMQNQLTWIREFAKDCEIVDGILYYGRSQNIQEMRIAVPAPLRIQLLEENHAITGHFSVEKTYQKMVSKYWWPFMKRDIALYCKSCRICRARQGEQKAWLPPLGHLPVPSRPNDMVGIDLVNMPLSENGFKYIMVVTDVLSRKAATAPLYNKTAKEVAEALMRVWFAHEGPARRILSDRGSEFTSTIFRQLCHLCGVKNIYTTALHPAGNPIAEKFNKLLVDGLTKLKDHRLLSWDVLLPIFTMAYNGTVHRAHGMTPHKVHFGREMNSLSMSPLAAVQNPYKMSENVEDCILLAPNVWKAARQAIEDYNEQTKKYHDQFVTKKCPFRIGDLVWYRRAKTDKLVSPWTGPWKILEIDTPVVKIQFYDPETKKYYVDTAHMSNLSKTNLDPSSSPFPSSYHAKGLAKPQGVGRDVNFCDQFFTGGGGDDGAVYGDLGLELLYNLSLDSVSDTVESNVVQYVYSQDQCSCPSFVSHQLNLTMDSKKRKAHEEAAKRERERRRPNRMNSEMTRHVKELALNGVGLPGIQYRATPFARKFNPIFNYERFPNFGRFHSRFHAQPGAEIRTVAESTEPNV